MNIIQQKKSKRHCDPFVGKKKHNSTWTKMNRLFIKYRINPWQNNLKNTALSIMGLFFSVILLASCSSISAQPSPIPDRTSEGSHNNPVETPQVSAEGSMTDLSPAPTDNKPEASDASVSPGTEGDKEAVETAVATASANLPPEQETVRTDYAAFLPNEAGKIPVVMFHKFVVAFEAGMDKNYTNTFEQLEVLLQYFYDHQYRLISMDDFLNGNITVAAGYKPLVFTFDDGTPSQFNLVEEAGILKLNPDTAVGVMQAFYEKHPDFGLHANFYLNMDIGESTFRGAGTLEERLTYLKKLGLEIGTHTWGHVDLRTNGTKADIEKALGKNEAALKTIIPEESFHSFALAYGARPKDESARRYLADGSYEGIPYHYDGVFAVGAGFTDPSYTIKFNPLYIERVRATGMQAVEADLDWWLERIDDIAMYVSDGNPETVVTTENRADKVNPERLNGKTLVTYTVPDVQTDTK